MKKLIKQGLPMDRGYDEYVKEVLERAVEVVNSSQRYDGFDLKKDGDGGKLRMLRFYHMQDGNTKKYSVVVIIMNGRVSSSDMNLEALFNVKHSLHKV